MGKPRSHSLRNGRVLQRNPGAPFSPGTRVSTELSFTRCSLWWNQFVNEWVNQKSYAINNQFKGASKCSEKTLYLGREVTCSSIQGHASEEQSSYWVFSNGSGCSPISTCPLKPPPPPIHSILLIHLSGSPAQSLHFCSNKHLVQHKNSKMSGLAHFPSYSKDNVLFTRTLPGKSFVTRLSRSPA